MLVSRSDEDETIRHHHLQLLHDGMQREVFEASKSYESIDVMHHDSLVPSSFTVLAPQVLGDQTGQHRSTKGRNLLDRRCDISHRAVLGAAIRRLGV